jgi:hypothetical protein
MLKRMFLFVCLELLIAANGAFAAQATPAWQQEWEKTLELAKKEGQVTVYISGYEAVLPDFEKEFPDIKLVAVTGRGNQLGQRLLSERRAEKYIADVVSAGANPNFQQFHPAKALDPNRTGICSIPSGKEKSRRGISARPAPAPATRASSIIIRSLGLRLSSICLVRWTLLCFGIFAKGRIGWPRENFLYVFFVTSMSANNTVYRWTLSVRQFSKKAAGWSSSSAPWRS